MIALRTKLLGPGEEVPVTAERTHQVAVEAVLDTGEGFKIIVYLDSNGDFSIDAARSEMPGTRHSFRGKWK